MELQLHGKTAVVTGGSRGLGAAICEALAREGAHVAVNYCENSEKAQALVDRILRRAAGKAYAIQADVSREDDVAKLFSETEKHFGPADILVNNAGICPVRMIVDTDFSEWKRVMEINVDATFLTCREFARRCIRDGRPGRIVNIVSQAAFNGSKNGKTPYACSKGAEVSFTVSFAKEAAKYGIQVNAVAPGMIATDLTQISLKDPADYARYNSSIPAGRLGEPEEIADAVVFLASAASLYCTGSVLDVTGGMIGR